MKILLNAILALSFTSSIHAALKLASPFKDHMVLQREMAVPVWGWADPGAGVEVRFGDQIKKAKADAEGSWKVALDPLEGSFDGAKLMVKASTGESMELSDVVVGEVWICSGQSNMQFSYKPVKELSALVPTAKHIRSFQVKRTVAFEEQDECGGEWAVEVPDSAVGFGFAYYLQEIAEVPVGIILTAWGSSSIEAWMPRDMTSTVPHFKTIMEEFDADTETRQKIEASLNGPQPWSRPEDVFLRRQPNILYNAMMKPLAPFACRGVAWYQGERNTQSMHGMLKEPWFSRNSGMLKYGDTLQKWIQRYRKEWGREDLEFLIVMLPRCFPKPLATGPKGGPDSPIVHSWAWLRESQLKALELPHTGVANTIDLGHIKNVHPTDKAPIGERLALLAARDTLGKDVIADGPMLEQAEAVDGSVVVHFKHAEGLKTKDGLDPSAFWVADDSKKWVPASATIKGDTVVLRSDEIKKPLYVRYAFAGFPEVNLVNGSGLPAYPFRTDRFDP